MGGVSYQFAMFYTGTQDPEGNGGRNSIGVAFATSLAGPWVKRTGALIERRAEESWGVGQPTATAIEGGRVLLAYTRSNPTRMYAQELDLSDAGSPIVRKAAWALSTQGIPDGLLCRGDMGFRPTDRRFYMVHDAKQSAPDPTWLSNTVFCSSIAEADFWDDQQTGSWTLHGTIDQETTGWVKNHNAGLVKNLYGMLLEPGVAEVPTSGTPCMTLHVHVSVAKCTAWPEAFWTYRLARVDVALRH